MHDKISHCGRTKVSRTVLHGAFLDGVHDTVWVGGGFTSHSRVVRSGEPNQRSHSTTPYPPENLKQYDGCCFRSSTLPRACPIVLSYRSRINLSFFFKTGCVSFRPSRAYTSHAVTLRGSRSSPCVVVTKACDFICFRTE